MKNYTLLIICLVLGFPIFAQNTYPWPSTGNIGIGTSAPGYKLHVKSPDIQLVLQTDGTGNNRGIAVFADANGTLKGSIGLFGADGSIRMGDETDYRLVMKGGNIGIGTTTPGAKLEIYSPGTTGSTLIYGGVIGTKSDGHELNLVGGIPLDGAWPTQHGGHIRLGGSARGDVGKNAIQFIQNGVEQMRVHDGGNVGIGTSTPGSKLHVAGGTVTIGPYASTALPVGRLSLSGAGGELSLLSRASTSFVETPTNGERWSVYNHTNGTLRFWTGDDKMVITPDGKLGIGTLSPNQKLTVNGTIYGKEVKVDLSVPGPDYVFEEEYSLPSLEAVQSYIDQNKHLPEVPSAKEMETNGINLSEMNMLLLKKVEELTLYMIELKKENEEQNKIINALIERK